MNVLEPFATQLTCLAIVYILVFFVVCLDLISGLQKAKRRGKLRSSYAMRKTVDKLVRYFSMLLVITAIDAVQMLAISQWDISTGHHLPILPFLTFLAAMFVGFIELKSIYENSEEKEQARFEDAADALGKLIAKFPEVLDELKRYKTE
jgi:hypothetical protein